MRRRSAAMIPRLESTTAMPSTTPSSGPSTPPQRQSCDRCYRQKLRCIRKKDNGDTCDRCLSKRTRCVYSSSLPKGRPSLRRLKLGEQNTGNTTSSEETTSPQEVPQPISTSRPSSEFPLPMQKWGTAANLGHSGFRNNGTHDSTPAHGHAYGSFAVHMAMDPHKLGGTTPRNVLGQSPVQPF
jgi:hypothetical protein